VGLIEGQAHSVGKALGRVRDGVRLREFTHDRILYRSLGSRRTMVNELAGKAKRRSAMKRFLALVVMLAFCALPLTAQADCPGDCVETCSAGPAEDYVKCLNACVAGCTPDPVPAPSPPVPVPEPAPEPKK